MKTYVFEAYVKNEKRAKSIAQEFLKDLGENPKNFAYEISRVKYFTYRIICKEIIA